MMHVDAVRLGLGRRVRPDQRTDAERGRAAGDESAG
jgi:hypothetical protein